MENLCWLNPVKDTTNIYQIYNSVSNEFTVKCEELFCRIGFAFCLLEISL